MGTEKVRCKYDIVYFTPTIYPPKAYIYLSNFEEIPSRFPKGSFTIPKAPQMHLFVLIR